MFTGLGTVEGINIYTAIASNIISIISAEIRSLLDIGLPHGPRNRLVLRHPRPSLVSKPYRYFVFRSENTT